jgi:hypothetical protein
LSDVAEPQRIRTQLPDALGIVEDGVFHLHTKFSVMMNLDGTKYLVTNKVDETDKIRTRDGEPYTKSGWANPKSATDFFNIAGFVQGGRIRFR